MTKFHKLVMITLLTDQVAGEIEIQNIRRSMISIKPTREERIAVKTAMKCHVKKPSLQPAIGITIRQQRKANIGIM